MKPKNKKIITAVTALAMTLSMTMSVHAQSLLDIKNEVYPTENSMAILSYDPDNDTYELLDGEEKPISVDFTKTEDSKEKTAPTEGPTIIKRAVVPSVTSKPSSNPDDDKKWYVAKYRPKTTTAVKPVTTTKKTTAKTTVKTTAKTTPKPSTGVPYKGIDVSRYQGDIDWAKVKKAGIEFVMIRAGYGKHSDQVDAKFKTNIAGAQKAGIECGVYWYSYALNTSDALQEAKNCYNTIKGYKLSYPVAFDIEDSSQMGLTNTQLSNITKVFCNYIETQKYYATVYSFASMFRDRLNSSVTSKYDVWVAHIKVSKPGYDGKYGMWQYSHTGRVNGISTDVDLNYSYKYYPDIMKKNKLNGYK